MAMKMEYESLLKSIKELKKQMSRQVRKKCKVTGSIFVFRIFRKLEKYHKQQVLNLVQGRIYELGGIGSKMSTIEPASHSNACGHTLCDNKRPGLPSSGEVKQGSSDAKVPKKPSSGKDLVTPLEKAELLRENMSESSNLPDCECEKLVGTDPSPLIYITEQQTNQSPKPLSRLSGEHLRLVMEKVHIGMLKDLNKILHSITFDTRERFPPREWPPKYMMTLIKVAFEKSSGFQVLAYLYKFGLISRVELNSFFDSKKTLDLTAGHLIDVFHPRKNSLPTYHALIPDIVFISNNWNTEHLRYLKDLDEEKQGYIVYRILKWACENCINELIAARETVREAVKIFEFFVREKIFQEIKKWSPKPWNCTTNKPEQDILRENIESMISLFNLFPVSTEGQAELQKYKLRKIFLLNYYIIKFLKTYGSGDIRELIQDYAKDDRRSRLLAKIYGEGNFDGYMIDNPHVQYFGAKFDLITHGLEIHQLTNQNHDFSYLLAYPEGLRHLIPQWINKNSQEDLEKKIQQVMDKYRSRYNQIKEFSQNNVCLRTWTKNKVVRSILNIYEYKMKMEKPGRHYNMWLNYMDFDVEFVPRDEDELGDLCNHLSWNYNLIDMYHEWSRDVYDGLMESYSQSSSLIFPIASSNQEI